MSKKNDADFLEILSSLQAKIFKNKPSVEEMYTEVRMMKFKIKPLQGDVSVLNLQNSNLIEALWFLGKLDDFFQTEFQSLSPTQKNVFYRLFNTFHTQFQDQLNNLNLRQEKLGDASVVEMEIFREYPLQRKTN